MRTLVTVAIALFLAPSALGDGGPSPGVSGDGRGITDQRTGLNYSALDGTTDTFIIVRDRHGRQVRSAVVRGGWGIPSVTFNLAQGGLSFDGSTLVLEGSVGARPASKTRLLVLDTATLRSRRHIVLDGNFSYDALSPDNRTLFLIQHTSTRDFQRYRVRAYDLARGSLRPEAIVDKTEPNMAGYPVLRLVGPGGRWVYTLYVHGNEYFVHALDTVRARARCLDLDWHGEPNVISAGGLELRGHRLAVVGRDGTTLTSVRVPAKKQAAGWATAGWTTAASLAAVAAAAYLLWLRRRTKAP